MTLSTSLAISLSKAAENLAYCGREGGGGMRSECYSTSSASGMGFPNSIL